jgi:hypothetical protein
MLFFFASLDCVDLVLPFLAAGASLLFSSYEVDLRFVSLLAGAGDAGACRLMGSSIPRFTGD